MQMPKPGMPAPKPKPPTVDEQIASLRAARSMLENKPFGTSIRAEQDQIDAKIRELQASKKPTMPVPKPVVEQTPAELDEYWPEKWQKRRLKPGAAEPKIKAYKQTQGPYFISMLTYGKCRMTTYERTTEAAAVEFSMQFYMNETRQGIEDSEPVE